jgi:hypothetical protein
MIEIAMRVALSFLMLVALPAMAADRWLLLRTPEFELYTQVHNQNGEKESKDTMLRFEQLRAFFLKASPVRKGADFPVRVIEFSSDKEFGHYRVSEAASAFFADTPARDYIVLGEAARENFSIAIHEYMHLIVSHSGLKLPVWLNEGWADVYSTLRPMGKETAIGDLLDGRMKDLDRYPWLSFSELTSVDTHSPQYNEASRAGIFYAESWALTHMLYFAPEYEPGFGKFVTALNQGHNAAEACQLAWGRSPTQVFADLRTYFERKRIVGRAYAIQLAKEQIEPLVSPVNDFAQSLMLADLLAATGKSVEARRIYEDLDKEQPGNSDVAISLGYLAWQGHDPSGVLKNFAKAYDEGSTDPRMCFQLSVLMHESNQTEKAMIPVLQRAVKSKPDYTDAQVQLGVIQVDTRDFAGGITTLMGIQTIEPEVAPVVFCALGAAYMETGDFAAARRNLQTCQKWSKTAPQLARVKQLSALLDSRSH